MTWDALSVGVIVPWRPSEPFRQIVLEYVMQHLTDQLAPDELCLCDDDGLTFNRGRALAAGVEQTKSDVLVFADADVLIDGTALRRAVRGCVDVSYVVPFNRLVGLTHEASVEVLGGRQSWSIDWMTERADDVELDWPRLSTGGCNVMTREHYEQGGGFDARFAGWGFEDAAFDICMQTLVGEPVWLDSCAVHLWHPHDTTRSDNELIEAGLSLARRYEAASGDVEQLRALIEERP